MLGECDKCGEHDLEYKNTELDISHNKNIYGLPPCAFCKQEIEGANYIWLINKDMSRNICCFICMNKKNGCL